MPSQWTFLTNHAVILILIAHESHLTAREIAARLQITERTVHRIINDLEMSGYIHKQKAGRTNHYEIRTDQLIEHPALSAIPVAMLLQVFGPRDTTSH